MKAHPIPQNILDIEFKLFTKFTVREFVYMAVGLGFGGIFLLLYSNGTIPALIAIPIFLFSTGCGLFLGLVPINDQNADIFLGNYFKAITRPTQRVWRNEQFDEKVQWIADQKGISLTAATMDRANATDTKNDMVIGGTSKSVPKNQFVEESVLNELDQEEAERLKELEQIAIEETGQIPQASQTIQISQNDQVAQDHRPIQGDISSQSLQDGQLTESAGTAPQSLQVDQLPESARIAPQSLQVDQLSGSADLSSQGPNSDTNVDNITPLPEILLDQAQIQVDQNDQEKFQITDKKAVIENTDPPRQEVKPNEPLILGNTNKADNIDHEQITKTSSSSVSSINLITISKDTIDSYKTEVEGYTPKQGNISLYITDKEGNPIPQALIMIKDENNSVVQVYISDPQGLVTPSHQLKNGKYTVEIKEDSHTFPVVNYILDNEPLAVANIKSTN